MQAVICVFSIILFLGYDYVTFDEIGWVDFTRLFAASVLVPRFRLTVVWCLHVLHPPLVLLQRGVPGRHTTHVT